MAPTQPNQPPARSDARPAVRPQLLWLIVAVLALLGALQVFLSWREIVDSGMDIQQDFVAAQRLWRGEDIYAPIRPAEISALGVHEENGVGMRLNVHPPVTALLFAPLALLSFPAATLIWTLLSVALLWGVVELLRGELGLPLAGPWRLIAPLLLLSWYPVWQHLHVGQFTILLLALIVGAWWAERRGRPWLAGALLGAAVVIKIYPALLLGYALLGRRWRVLGGAALAGLALLGAQAAIDPGQWPAYFMQVAPANAAEWMPNARNASLASVSMRLFVGSDEVRPVFALPQLELPLRALLYATAGALFLATLWRRRGNHDAEYSLGLSTIALLSPLSWDHSFVFLLLPFAYLWQQARLRPGRWRRWAIGLAACALLLSLFPAELVFASLKRAYHLQQMPAWVHLHAVGVLVLLCGYAATLVTLRATAQPAPATPHPLAPSP